MACLARLPVCRALAVLQAVKLCAGISCLMQLAMKLQLASQPPTAASLTRGKRKYRSLSGKNWVIRLLVRRGSRHEAKLCGAGPVTGALVTPPPLTSVNGPLCAGRYPAPVAKATRLSQKRRDDA